MAIEVIIGAIESATGLKAVYKGGNQSSPIEYSYYRIGTYQYRLEINLNGNNIVELTTLQNTIYDTINDFYDNPKFENLSIEIDGGGSFSNGSRITLTTYFDVYDYLQGGKCNESN